MTVDRTHNLVDLCRPEQWRQVSLATVGDVRFSSVDKHIFPNERSVHLCNYIDVYENDYITSALEFSQGSATRTEIARFGLQVGDVIITKDSETPDDIGVPAVIDYAPADLVCGYHLALIRPRRTQTDSTFLAKQLGHYRLASYFGRCSNGLTRYGLPLEIVRKAPIWLPKIEEQVAIGCVARLVDATIAATEHIIAKLSRIKLGLMQDLLTRGIDEKGIIRSEETHKFKDSLLGRIPEAWDVAQLETLKETITSGSRGWAAYYSDDGPLFLRIGNLTRDHIDLRLSDLMHVNPPMGSEGSRTRVEEGDVLVSITADLGIIGVAPRDIGEAFVNQHIALVKLDRRKVRPRWVGYYLAGEKGQKQFYRLNDPGAKAGLNLPTVDRLLVAIPPAREQEDIVAIADAQVADIRAQELYRGKVERLKKGLMEDLLTGKVRVNQLLKK